MAGGAASHQHRAAGDGGDGEAGAGQHHGRDAGLGAANARLCAETWLGRGGGGGGRRRGGRGGGGRGDGQPGGGRLGAAGEDHVVLGASAGVGVHGGAGALEFAGDAEHDAVEDGGLGGRLVLGAAGDGEVHGAAGADRSRGDAVAEVHDLRGRRVVDGQGGRGGGQGDGGAEPGGGQRGP
ncbi:hypothetical protein EBN88_22225 [Streptomyces triticirhizae]|uniref:Uncharacterized protein n=1 Tax=Streptomyces triticirhizae TaxID=2483353 RepID=A0A3M2LGI5_9ACTN|nr:hypothetical protein EBN88_22225 [Streptomyces triticirhizae]